MASHLVLLPGAPVVVPELSRTAWREVEGVYDAGLRALRAAADPGTGIRIIVGGPDHGEFGRIRHDLRRWGAPEVRVGPEDGHGVFGSDSAEAIPGAALIGWWWSDRAGLVLPSSAPEVSPGVEVSPVHGVVETHVVPVHEADAAERVAELIRSAPGLVVLVADGPSALAPKAPIPERESALALDADLASFIDYGTALPERGAESAARDGWYSAALWQGLAAVVGSRHANESAHAAPFGVGYHVARWARPGEGDRPGAEPGSSSAARTPRARVPRAKNSMPRESGVALGPTEAKEVAPGGAETTADRRPIVVVGPTGTGKSDLALDLAERLGGQIVNLDAMQLYRGMDIGTAKVPPGERRGIAHHMFDVLEVTETASVADYQRDARAAVERIMAAGDVPVVVGGSMLYYQSLLDEWEFPETDPDVRAKYERRLAEIGVEALHAELAVIDPEAAATILPSDPRRTVRALEVVEITGKPFAASRPRIGRPRWGAHLLGLDVPTEELDPRLEERTAAMFSAGLVAEVRALERAGLRDGVTARRAIGYAHVLAAIDESGGADPEGPELDEAIFRTFVGTRRYVRRQRSWFRRDERITWLDASASARESLLDDALEAIGSAERKASR